jgi:acetyl-CoA synthetase
MRNLAALGFEGPIWGVHPNRRLVHGQPCVPTLDDLPEPVDAVVIAIPAASVPAVVRAAGRRGCGSAVVYAAGFAEAGAVALQAELTAAAAEFALPVIGPNCDGLVSFHCRAALYGDVLAPRAAGRVALLSQSGNVAVNALATGRGLRFHTVASIGNQAVLDAAALLDALVDDAQLGSVALFLEADGDGPRLARALARAAERGIGVAVLKVGATAAGATAAAAHTGALAGDQRVFRALVEEAGGAWADDVHDLLELAKALAVPGARVAAARPAAGLAVLTCSGGDSGLAADESGRLGLPLPALAEPTVRRLRELLPAAATAANPLDYTAVIWGERERIAAIVRTVADDPAVDQLLLFYDEPARIGAGLRAEWIKVREGLGDGAAGSAAHALLASTLPELLQDESATAFIERGIPAVAGLRTALVCAAALRRAPGDAERLRAIAAAADAPVTAGEWLGEADAKALLAARGVAVPAGEVVRDAAAAVRAARALGGAVALKATGSQLRHKSDAGALVLGVSGDEAVRSAYARAAAAAEAAGGDAQVLVEAMAAPGVELIVAARRGAVVPALVVGLGGVWTELLGDAAVVPLPASPERVRAALATLRGAALLDGARGHAAVDVDALAALAARAGELLLSEPLELLELNPVIANPEGAVAVDALARRVHT